MKRELQRRIERLQVKKEMKKDMISANVEDILSCKETLFCMGYETEVSLSDVSGNVEAENAVMTIVNRRKEDERLYKEVHEISEEIKTMNTLMDMITRDEANNKELCRFRDYLHYYRGMSEEKMMNLTEEEFEVLKNYYYKEEEHHELDADYADYMDIVNSYFA